MVFFGPADRAPNVVMPFDVHEWWFWVRISKSSSDYPIQIDENVFASPHFTPSALSAGPTLDF